VVLAGGHRRVEAQAEAPGAMAAGLDGWIADCLAITLSEGGGGSGNGGG